VTVNNSININKTNLGTGTNIWFSLVLPEPWYHIL